MIRLERLPLPVPVNRQWRTGPRGVYLSKEANAKRKLIVASIHDKLGGPPVPIAGPCQLSITWTPRDKRIADVDAYIKGAMDALQAAGVYVDDNLVDMVTCERMVAPVYPGWWDVEVWEIGGTDARL